MFRKTSAQSSFFELDIYFPNILPKDDWSYIYRDEIYPLINEEKFKHLFTDEKGRPNTSIKSMVSILIFMGMEKLTWRGAEFQFRHRVDWWIATHTPVGEAFIDHTTLFKFYVNLERDKVVRKLFEELAGKFVELCGTSLKRQRTDSFFIHGWLQILSRYGLFKETIRHFLQNLRKQKPGLYEKIRPELSREYLEKEFDLTEKDREEAHRQIKLMAHDLYVLHSTFSTHHQVKHYQSFQTLATVFHQQCEVIEGEDAASREVVIRDKPKGDQIICSPYNTDARYVRKGKQKVTGDKGFVTETCDPNNQTQFLTDVDVAPATASDSKELPEIQDRLDEASMELDEQYADAGFVNGRTILDSEERNISLEGPTAGRSQSFEAFNDEDRPLDTADFNVSIEEDSKELIVHACPANQIPISQSQSKKTGNTLVHFDPEICSSCPFKERCPVKIGKRVATVTFDKTSYTGASRHHQYMGDSDYRKQCATRAGVEGTVSELTRGHGMRKSRHRTRDGTVLQLLFAGIGCNVKRFISHAVNYGLLDPATP